jgi:hypothetical protein
MPLHLFLASLLAALLASGCAAPQQFQYSDEVGSRDVTAEASQRGEVTLVWRFGTPEWVRIMCGTAQVSQSHGCAMREPGGGRCLIFTVAPIDFQDRDRLAVLGHEVWHCQGARHAAAG